MLILFVRSGSVSWSWLIDLSSFLFQHMMHFFLAMPGLMSSLSLQCLPGKVGAHTGMCQLEL